MTMKQRKALRRMRERAAARGHPLWWVLGGILVGIGGTMMAAFWRSADDEPRTAFGTRVPGYLEKLAREAASAPASSAVASTPAGRRD